MRAPKKCKLRSLRCSKLRSLELGCCKLRARSLLVASSKLAASSELAATSSEQQASELGACLLRARSLLLQAPSNKLWSLELACCELEACCSKLRSSELVATQAWSSELACCKFVARSLLAASSELALQQAPELEACLLRARGLLQQALELGACLLRVQSLLQQAPSSKLQSSKLACCEFGACCSKLRTYSELGKLRSSPGLEV